MFKTLMLDNRGGRGCKVGCLFGVLIGAPAPARVVRRTTFASSRSGRIIIFTRPVNIRWRGYLDGSK